MATTQQISLAAGAEAAAFDRGSVYFIGTATTIIRYGGITILTDPNFLHKGEYVRLGYGLRSRRRTDPAIDIEELPFVDLVVLSHMHEDHFDRVVEAKLNKNLPIVSTHHAVTALQKMGFKSTYALDTWDSIEVTRGDARLRITSMPGRHSPGPLAFALPPVMGSMLDFSTPTTGSEGATEEARLRIYITGDTLVYDDIRDIPRRYPDIDVALLHLGGTRVLGIYLTMDGKQGVQMMRIVRPRVAVPIHYNDYTVFKSPLRDFARRVRAAGLSNRVKYLKHGDTFEFWVPLKNNR
jgi:L-ascorbate metabolism protein UlaG (beta-lactamase superfamily)